MSLLRSFCIAFGMYSKIPMPKFEWNPKDMRYTMCFFPLVSIPITALVLFLSVAPYPLLSVRLRNCYHSCTGNRRYPFRRLL